MTPAQFRKIALGLPDAVEASHMKHPDFRAANGKIFATLTEKEDRACVMLTPDQQAEFLKDAPGVFEPAAGSWGRGGATMIVLKYADAEIVGEAVTQAWQRISALPPAKSKAKKRPSAKTKAKTRKR
ncbi:MAG TPA: MmcQ/YjbR family DNA-binding protein [Vicinamibacterales bacterium]